MRKILKFSIFFINYFFDMNALKFSDDKHIEYNAMNNIYINKIDFDNIFKIINNYKIIYFNYLEKFNSQKNYYKIIYYCIILYFIIGYYCEVIAKKVVRSDIYKFCFYYKKKDIKKIFLNINNNLSLQDYIAYKEFKTNFDFLFYYKSYIYFFILFPFIFNNSKQVLFNINNIINKVKLINNYILLN